MAKNESITIRIAALLVQGMEVREAYEAVLGEGSWEKMAGEIWEAAQK